jgi:uncharacterized protein (UPF0332 family)
MTGSFGFAKTRAVGPNILKWTAMELAQMYNDLFERRQEGDYMDFVDFEEPQVRPWTARAEQFVEHIASIIESHRE